MRIPFDTHRVYIILDDDKMYKLNQDFKRIAVSKIKRSEKDDPSIVLRKSQFDTVKSYLLNKENPFRINSEDAEIYYKLGFISLDEKTDYINEED